MHHRNVSCSNIKIGSGDCPKCNPTIKSSDEVWDEAVEETRLILECSNCKLELRLRDNITLKALNDEAEVFARQHRTRIGNMWCKKENIFIRRYIH